jgi:hypothetical protein
MISGVSTSAFAMKHRQITHLLSSTINCRQIYIKKMKLQQLTAVEQGISTVNRRRMRFFSKLKSWNINYHIL